jgi:hypothetical protein
MIKFGNYFLGSQYSAGMNRNILAIPLADGRTDWY